MSMESNNMEGQQTKYVQIEEDLKELIFSDKIQPGDKLPSENALAEKYQVSRQTVRKALNELIHEGYIYAEHGRGTFCSEMIRRLRNSKNIGVIMTYMSDYIFAHVLKGIDSVLSDEDYSIIIKTTKNSRTGEAKCLEELLQKDIDGLIIEPSKSHIYCRHINLYRKLEEFKIPYVFIQGCYSQMRNKYPHVLMDDEEGGYLITKYLIDLGHRNIVGVFKSDDSQGQNRHRGFVRALNEAGVPYDADKVVWFYTEDRKIHPHISIKNMVENGCEIDGVVCYNDQIALEVVRALAESGLRVPEDVSVTGYDDFKLANAFAIQLTTIRHPQEELGEIAAEMLLDIMKGGQGERNVVIKPELVVGNSCMARGRYRK